MSKKDNKSKDGSINLHIYNQEDAIMFRTIAKLKGISPQKLASQVIHNYIQNNLQINLKEEI
jgi:hypothetical protein